MPKRTSDQRKTLLATARTGRQRAPSGGDRLTTAPAPPKDMSEGARREWKGLAADLVAAGTLAASDLRALRLLSEVLAQIGTLEAVLAKEGLTIPGSTGAPKAHPAIAGLAQARAMAHRLLSDFGMIPSARSRVDELPDTDDDADPAAAYFR